MSILAHGVGPRFRSMRFEEPESSTLLYVITQAGPHIRRSKLDITPSVITVPI